MKKRKYGFQARDILSGMVGFNQNECQIQEIFELFEHQST